MGCIRGKINKDITLVEYEGEETATAGVVVSGKKIGVGVKGVPGVLKIIHGDEVISYDGSESKSFVIDADIAKGTDLVAETLARKEADQDIIDAYSKKIDDVSAKAATKTYVDEKISESKLYRHDICLNGYEGDNFQIYFTLIDTNASAYTQKTLADAINAAAILPATGWYGVAAPMPVVAFTSSANNFSFQRLKSDGRAWTDVLWATDMMSVNDKVTAL